MDLAFIGSWDYLWSTRSSWFVHRQSDWSQRGETPDAPFVRRQRTFPKGPSSMITRRLVLA